MLVGVFMLKLLEIEALERFVNIGVPVALFFFFEYFIDQHRSEDTPRFVGVYPRALFNGMFWMAFLAAFDAGFSIIFMLFQLMYQAFRSLLPEKKGRRRSSGWAPYVRAGIAIALFGAVLMSAGSFIETIFAHPALFFWLFLLPVAAGLTAYFSMLVFRSYGEAFVGRNWLMSGGGRRSVRSLSAGRL